MKALFDTLIQESTSQELIDEIVFAKSRPLFLLNPATHKFHPAAANVFTWIGNIAKEYGERDVMQMAREMRDEIKELCEEEMYEREYYVEYKE